MYRVLIILLIITACAKSPKPNKEMPVNIVYGENDPCFNSSDCKMVDIIEKDDPTALLRLSTYFPNFNPDKKEIDYYHVGQKFKLQKEEILNQRLDLATKTFKDGCTISYFEEQVITELQKEITDDYDEVVDRIIYDYTRSNPTLIAGDEEACQEFIEDDYFFTDDARGESEHDLFESVSVIDQFTQTQGIQLLVVKIKNKYFLRTAVTQDDLEFSVTVFNPRTRRVETVETKIDIKGVSIFSPGENFNKLYDYSLQKTSDSIMNKNIKVRDQ